MHAHIVTFIVDKSVHSKFSDTRKKVNARVIYISDKKTFSKMEGNFRLKIEREENIYLIFHQNINSPYLIALSPCDINFAMLTDWGNGRVVFLSHHSTECRHAFQNAASFGFLTIIR